MRQELRDGRRLRDGRQLRDRVQCAAKAMYPKVYCSDRKRKREEFANEKKGIPDDQLTSLAKSENIPWTEIATDRTPFDRRNMAAARAVDANLQPCAETLDSLDKVYENTCSGLDGQK